jgi:SAM-dependent methyltransferase
MPDKYIEAPPEGAAGWREVWVEDRRYRPASSMFDVVGGFLRRLLRRAGQAEAERQRNFNVALLDVIGDVRREIDEVRGSLRAGVAALQRDIQDADSALARDIAGTRAVIPVASMRNDALIAALDQKLETLAVRLRDVTNGAVEAPASRAQAIPGIAQSDDFLYRRLEDGLRGSEAEVREAVAPYVEFAREHQPLFDVGCGRGELLLACREAELAASGCDTNERSVADLRQRGVSVSLAGVPECFTAIAGESLGSIAALHVVEHLPVAELFALFREAARVLKAGGVFMIETPNAESLFVSGSQFWRDPTHLAPRHVAALVLLGREHGFEVLEARAVHEFPPGTSLAIGPDDSPQLQRTVAALNERLFAPQDLRLVLTKA